MKNIITIIILIIFCKGAFAQNDYIITLSRDTLYGSVITDNYARVIFKTASGKQETKFKAAQILGYYKAKKEKTFHRVNRSLEKEKYSLLPALVRGKIHVYEYVVQTGTVASVSYFATKKGTHFFEIKNNSFYGIFGRSNKQIDALHELLKDNEIIAKRYIEENKTSIKNLIKIIEEYNTH